MSNWTVRTELLTGSKGLNKLRESHVLVAGLGGVGSTAAEMICRAGIGNITIVDHDQVQASNLNRQLCALHSTIGKSKAEVVANRLLDINPALNLRVLPVYLKDETIPQTLSEIKYDYVIDAIDTLSPKFYLIYNCLQLKIPLVSSMGSGGKFDPTRIEVADISKTYNCKLAHYIRKKLHKHQIYKGFKAVFSDELTPEGAMVVTEGEINKRSMVGTISYMPVAFGCTCASVVIRDLLQEPAQ
jgi:tRNA threonylcarbamoyladenosine dehydratase